MHVLYACDEGFTPVLKASLHSLLSSHEPGELHIHIAAECFSQTSIESVEKLAADFGQNLDIQPMPNFSELLGKEIDPKRFTLSAFSRLFVDSLVDASLDRIIYLDCDTIVTSSLKGLWDFDLGGAVIGAVNDCRNWRYVRNLGLSRNAVYVNSGVLLIDLEKFREGGWQKIFRDGMLAYDGLLEFPDNDLICMLMQDHLTVLPPQYNMISPVRMCSYAEVRRFRRPTSFYDRDSYEQAKANPVVLHYTTFFGLPGRPWIEGYDSDDGAPFRPHFVATGGVPWPRRHSSALRRCARQVLRSPLRRIAMEFFGVLHAVVKPELDSSNGRRIREIQRSIAA